MDGEIHGVRGEMQVSGAQCLGPARNPVCSGAQIFFPLTSSERSRDSNQGTQLDWSRLTRCITPTLGSKLAFVLFRNGLNGLQRSRSAMILDPRLQWNRIEISSSAGKRRCCAGEGHCRSCDWSVMVVDEKAPVRDTHPCGGPREEDSHTGPQTAVCTASVP